MSDNIEDTFENTLNRLVNMINSESTDLKEYHKVINKCSSLVHSYKDAMTLYNYKSQIAIKNTKVSKIIPSLNELCTKLLDKNISKEDRFDSIKFLSLNLVMCASNLISKNNDINFVKLLITNSFKVINRHINSFNESICITNEVLNSVNESVFLELKEIEIMKKNKEREMKIDLENSIDNQSEIIQDDYNTRFRDELDDSLKEAHDKLLKESFLERQNEENKLEELNKIISKKNDVNLHISNLFIRNSMKFIENDKLSFDNKIEMLNEAIKVITHAGFRDIIVSSLLSKVSKPM